MKRTRKYSEGGFAGGLAGGLSAGLRLGSAIAGSRKEKPAIDQAMDRTIAKKKASAERSPSSSAVDEPVTAARRGGYMKPKKRK